MESQTTQLRAYAQFMDLLLVGNLQELGSLVDADRFVAFVPGGPEEGLDFIGLSEWFTRFRAPFNDFGQHVKYNKLIDTGHTVVASYTSRFTHTGVLSDRWGYEDIRPTGAACAMPCIDTMVFDEHGKIIELTMASDRLTVVEQARSAF